MFNLNKTDSAHFLQVNYFNCILHFAAIIMVNELELKNLRIILQRFLI